MKRTDLASARTSTETSVAESRTSGPETTGSLAPDSAALDVFATPGSSVGKGAPAR